MVHDEPIDYMLETSEDPVAELLADATDEEYEINANNDNLKYIPLATKTTYGVIKVGDGLSVVNGVLNVIGGGGSDEPNITKLSELENDVGFITNNTDKLINYYSKTETDNKLLVLDETIQTVQSAKADKSALNGLITNAVDDLVNYYKKSESYNKDEVNELVSKIPKFGVAVIDDLNDIPDDERSDTTIYLVPKTDITNGDYYDEYLWLNGVWEKFGSVKVNLNDYYNKTESAAKFIDFDSVQNVSGRKNFKDISFENLLLNNDVLLGVGSTGIHLGAEGYSISFTSKERPYIYVGDNLTLKSLAYTSDIPAVPTSTSQLTNDSGFITQTILNNNYYTAGETEQLITGVSDAIPTKLSQLQTDTNNQRVSATEKATWNNKSNFSGSYNDLTNKPDHSKYLDKNASTSQEVLGNVSFKNLQIIDQAGGQPTYINVDNTDGVLKIFGQYDFLELDYTNEKAYLLGYEIPLKQSGSTDDYVTKSTEQTITGVKRFSNPTYVSLLRDYSQSAHLLSFSNGVQYFGSPNHPMYLDSSSLVVEGPVRPTFTYYDDPYSQYEFAFLDDMPIKKVTESSVRIWDLPSGVYILPYYCKIYYNGATDTAKYHSAMGDNTMLYVNTSNDGAEKFFKFEYTTGWNAYYQYYVFTGMTTSTNGYARGVDLNARYPVGAYYISDNKTSPANLFGGVWEELPEGFTLWTTSTTSANAGTTISAGLPNIWGDLWHTNLPLANAGARSSDSAISVRSGGGATYTGFSSNKRDYAQWDFNASRYNSIYGNSTTVQPPAYRVYAWRRIE